MSHACPTCGHVTSTRKPRAAVSAMPERAETTTTTLKSEGYRCHLETITGQGYYGGDGVTCYRVRRADGTLAIHALSTYLAAWQAWGEAARLSPRSVGA